MASGFTAGEESRGTIDVLLSYPVSRRRVVLEKAAAVLVGCIVAAAAVWVLALAGAAASSSPLPADRLAEALVMLVLLGLAFGAMALAISAFSGNRAAAIGVAIGVMVVMYLIDALAAIVDGLNAIRPLSLFRYYIGNDPLRNGLNFADAGVLAAVIAVFLVAALVAFDRRDLAA
jgi:ABC-2 type transport system permease protein